MNQYHSIAIDGPSGAGKSTLARALAQEMGYRYVDTGAIYRTVGLAVHRSGIDPQNEIEVGKLLHQVDITMNYDRDGQQQMFLNGENVSKDIRQHIISGYASHVAALPCVRAFLLEKQRDLAEHYNVIMDGRDIGTVVLPQADVKIYLTADATDRANRRYLELIARGQQADLERILADVVERDQQDMERVISPLKKAEDAQVVDTTGKSLEESQELLKAIISCALHQKGEPV